MIQHSCNFYKIEHTTPPPQPPPRGGAPNKSPPVPYKVQPEKTNLQLMTLLR